MKKISIPWTHNLLLTGLFYLVCLLPGLAQNNLDQLESQLADSYGKDKLVILNKLTELHLADQNGREALRYARSAETLANAVISSENKLITPKDYSLKPQTYLLLGKAYQELERYPDSRIAFEKALIEATILGLTELEAQAEQDLEQVAMLSEGNGKKKKPFLGKAFRDITATIEKTSGEFGVLANLKLAQMHENNQNYEKAIKKYEQVINQLRNQGDWEQVEELREHLAEIQAFQGNVAEAVVTLSEIKEEKVLENDSVGAADVQKKIDVVSLTINTPKVSVPQPVLPEDQEIVAAEKKLNNIRIIAERAESQQDFAASLNYYKQYLAMEKTLAEQEKQQELTLLEKAHQIERQEQEIELLRQNKEISQLELTRNQAELHRQLILKRSLGGGLVLAGLLAFSLFRLYRNKQRDHQKLGVAYHDLEVAQDQLKNAEQKIKTLLNQQLSGAVANELLTGVDTQLVQRKFVCIMFLDIRDFTPYVEKLPPEEIIAYQNKVLGFMIEVVNKQGGIVNQILGDGFMATFGAPVSTGNDCESAYSAAREIINMVKTKGENGEIPPTKIGIGLHAGQVVAGNVGTKERKQYSITGNPVITAARLEQLNKDFGSTMVMSKEVYDHLPEKLKEPMAFNPVQVKGRSKAVEVATI